MGKRMIGIFLLIVVLFSLFTACAKRNYHTEILSSFTRSVISSDPQQSGLNESVLTENSTVHTFVQSKDPISGETNWTRLEIGPAQRCYVIKDQARLEEIFDEPPTVDFETQMIVVTFSTCKGHSSLRQTEVFLRENKLIFEIDLRSYNNGTWDPGSTQSVRVYRMDKLEEIEEVKIIYY